MKNMLATTLMAVTTVLFSGSTFADTYVVVINALKDNIRVNNNALSNGSGSWSALDALVETQNGTKLTIKDMHAKCKSGGWQIQSTGPKPTDYCINLGFGEVGCLFAAVRQDAGSQIPYIDMTKVALGNCSGKWWEQAGRGPITEITKLIADTGTSIAAAVGAVKGVKK